MPEVNLTHREREEVINTAIRLPHAERVEMLKAYGLYRSPEELKHLACEITARRIRKSRGEDMDSILGGAKRVGAGTGTERVS